MLQVGDKVRWTKEYLDAIKEPSALWKGIIGEVTSLELPEQFTAQPPGCVMVRWTEDIEAPVLPENIERVWPFSESDWR